ncbi:MAG: DNA topoisomerase IV subunit B [Candidatus Xenobia bacterium]
MAGRTAYQESSIRVLKGLEPVRQRPGMYTRTESPFHIVQEVIDNAADEALGGFARTLTVTMHPDGSVTVTDDGRGIPVGIHPVEGRPTVEVVFTHLHAGGKFDKVAGGAYAFSGGLHGVGVSVTNALSQRMEVEVLREGAHWRIVFADGDVVEELHRIGDVGPRTSGTRIRVWPNAKYFDSVNVSVAEMERLLRSKAVLLPGVKVQLTARDEVKTWSYPEGLRGYLKELLGENESVIPFFTGEKYAGKPVNGDAFAEGEGAAWAVVWTEEGPVFRESYVNLIPTVAGGTHEAGLREGLFNAVRNFIELHNLLPKGVKVLPEDVFSRVSLILSARVLDPQFQGQTKERLTSRDAVKLVSAMIKDPLELFLNEHVEYGKKIAELAIRQAQNRMKSAQKVEKKKGSGVAVLPGKLTDCESQDVTRTELFLVEGDSAGGSAKQGREKEFQAILPLRGKVLNTWEQERDRLYANAEVHNIAVAIGVDPHDLNSQADLSGLRYGKICILADADVDGRHIQVLLLTLFFRHFPKLIENGHIYVAQPPLFRIDAPGRGKGKPPRKMYAMDEGEMESMLDHLRKEGVKEHQWEVSRFKGLGEMKAEQLWETTMAPDTRRLLRVEMVREGVQVIQDRLHMLMAKGESGSRRSWLEAWGNQAEADI